MKVSIDLDGVAWAYPKQFAALVAVLQKGGAEVGILTAHDRRLFTEDVRLWKARGLPEPDFYYCHNDMREHAELDKLHDLRLLKLEFCKLVGIDWHIDDWDGRFGGGMQIVSIDAGGQSRS